MITNLTVQAPWLSSLANHLWQSTALVFVAWLLALALRKNQARTRYWVWLSASLKFLLPFSLLADVGTRIGSIIAAPMARPAFSSAMQQIVQITQPFPQASSTFMAAPAVTLHERNLLSVALLTLWAIGSLVVTASWIRRWQQVRAAVKTASPRSLSTDVPVLSSPSLLEPGVFGIWRPVLLLPEGIATRLTEEQLNAILAHELTHIRRRDNLTFALHMLVETIFWFHPLVWWIAARLIEEREHACDEAVLQSGSEAEVYAEGILNVCKFYVESPLACVSGVTGSDLKQRIVRIMTLSAVQKLGPGRRLLLTGAVALALVLPVVLGLLHTAGVRAQEDIAGAKPEFEVATIKPNKVADDRRGLYMSRGKFTVTGMPIAEVIRFAYDLKSDAQLAGGPSWVNSNKLDIEAKESDAQVQAFAKIPSEQMVSQVRLMVQSLLADRFNLKIGHDTKELPVYALVVAKNGPKMTVTEAPSLNPPGAGTPEDTPHKTPRSRTGIQMNGRGELEGMSTTTDLLADVLSRQQELGNRLVLDKTGLTDHYNWKLTWTPSNTEAPMSADGTAAPGGPAADASAPSLFTALQEQLGLKLEPQKAPVNVIVIDHIDPPSPN